MSPVRPYHRYRGLRDFTMGSLLEACRGLLSEIVPAQTRYKVTEYPTERTIRYYIARGLVDRPSGRRGTTSLYGYRHLLQVLAVKHLQSQYLPLRKIRDLLKGRSNREIEEILPGGKARASSTGTAAEGALIMDRHRPTTGKGNVPSPAEGHTRGGAPRNRGGECWLRHRVAPGVELHLHEDRVLSGSPEEAARWRARLLALFDDLVSGRGTGEDPENAGGS